jgi:uncharacterized protein (DUF427 family)
MGKIIEMLRRLIGADEDKTRPVQAIWNGQVIAESYRTIRLEGNHYFPARDVDFSYLEASPRKYLCPWKGVANYYDVVVDDVRNPGGAWCYRHPSPLARRIKDHVAFWQGVEIRRAPVGHLSGATDADVGAIKDGEESATHLPAIAALPSMPAHRSPAR